MGVQCLVRAFCTASKYVPAIMHLNSTNTAALKKADASSATVNWKSSWDLKATSISHTTNLSRIRSFSVRKTTFPPFCDRLNRTGTGHSGKRKSLLWTRFSDDTMSQFFGDDAHPTSDPVEAYLLGIRKGNCLSSAGPRFNISTHVIWSALGSVTPLSLAASDIPCVGMFSAMASMHVAASLIQL